MSALFLPFGNVGRGTWWLVQIITIAVAVMFVSRADTPIWQDVTAIASGHHVSPQQIAEHQRENMAALEAFIQSSEGRSWAFVFIALTWIGLMVEINRWHDRGMSGFWVLLRLVPSLLLATGSPAAGLVVFLVSGFQIVQLGFLGSAYSAPPPRKDWRAPAPWWKKNAVALITIAIAVGFVGFIVFRAVQKPGSVTSVDSVAANEFQSPAPISTSAAPNNLPPAMSPVSTVLTDSACRGTTDTNFGKDWVVLNGGKIQGIAAVILLPGAQVSILNADGGENSPGSKTSPGFSRRMEGNAGSPQGQERTLTINAGAVSSEK